MLFTSFEFIYFFLIILITYWSIPQRFRWILLLASSYFFYISWEPTYIILILLSTSIDYFLCRYLTGSNEDKKRKMGLLFSVIMNLGLLFAFKYYNFFQDALHDILGLVNVQYTPSESTFLLPVGISFYTFQTLSYSIDVYRKNFCVEKHFGKFALYVAYFPQLIAGPIVHHAEMMPQFDEDETHRLRVRNIEIGLSIFAVGLFKKVILADNFATFSSPVFQAVDAGVSLSMLEYWFGTTAFALQLYFDFSGYSDMAIGSARLFGNVGARAI